MRHSITALLIAVAFATLPGCGQTGPLYMPEEVPKPPKAEPVNSNQLQTKDS
jgi:predicted small lipoprotein YifL